MYILLKVVIAKIEMLTEKLLYVVLQQLWLLILVQHVFQTKFLAFRWLSVN
jgi:hypothetical protein